MDTASGKGGGWVRDFQKKKCECFLYGGGLDTVMARRKCPFCEFQALATDMRDHVKSGHMDRVETLLKKTNQRSIDNLRRRGVDPVNWAAGLVGLVE